MKRIQTNNALKPNGHYSQAVMHQGFLFVSGILPFDCRTGKFVEGEIGIQMRTVFENLDSILAAAFRVECGT